MTPLEHVGDGGVFASIDDLARWDAHFYAPTLGRAGDLVARQRRTGPFEGYAFGLVRETWRGLEVEMHGGAFAGYRAELMRFPAEGLSFVCLGNHASFDATGLAFAMAAAWFGDRLEAPEEKTPGPRDEEPATAAADEAPLPAGLAPRLAGAWSCAEFELPCRLAHRDGTLGLHFGKNRLFLGHAGGARFRAGEFEVEFLLAGDEVLGFTLRRGAQPPHVYRPRPAGAD